MIIVPLSDVPSQTVTVLLGGQNCQIAIYQRSTGLYCDLAVNNSPIIGGVICQNLNMIVRSLYLGFIGDLAFIDTQGKEDPTTPGLGTRFRLAYLELSDLNGLG